MKLRYFIEENQNNRIYVPEFLKGSLARTKEAHCDGLGLLILEAEPQVRSIFLQSQTKQTIRVPFPYMQFVFQYYKHKGKFIYPGLEGCGLRIFGTKKPIETITNKVFTLPTDMGGVVCTDHRYDCKEYDNLFDMTQEIITLWWGTQHILHQSYYNIEGWMRAKSFNKVKWPNAKAQAGSDVLLRLIGGENLNSKDDGYDDEYGSYIQFSSVPQKPLIDKTWSKDTEIT